MESAVSGGTYAEWSNGISFAVETRFEKVKGFFL